LEGFTRSLAKEIGRGSTVQLLRVSPGADPDPPSASCCPEVGVHQRPGDRGGPAPESGPTTPRRRVALVTGAARGIGAEVAATLARDGARVICLDVPEARDALDAVAARLGGTALPLDITAPDAGERIAAAAPDGLDVLVHNAGITRDRRLANMPADRWTRCWTSTSAACCAPPTTC